MKKLLAAVILVLGAYTSLYSQQNTPFDPGKLKLTWEVLDNNYEKKSQYLSVLTLTNTGQQALPGTGWKIYFNGGGRIQANSLKAPFKFSHVNGDLFVLQPAPSFKGIAPKASQPIEFVSSGRILNITNAPSGFYLVWDNTPEEGHALHSLEIKSLSAEQQQATINPVTPEVVYNRNKTIQDIPLEKLPQVFPTPASYNRGSGSFALTSDVPIVTDAAFKNEADLLAEAIGHVLGKKPSVSASASGKAIKLKQKSGLAPEAYELTVSPQEITVSATTPAGAFYGCQSLKTMLPPGSPNSKPTAVALATVEVKDAPRFGHRAFMLDVSRNFQQKDQILKLLDVMALYKLNVLHFHLNDDEGWRLEIPALPELTSVGGKRGHTTDNKKLLQASLGSGADPAKAPGSGFYTKADFVQILKYANERHIRVIPEIETPGHARAAIKAMDARYERLMAEGKKQEAERYLLRDLNDKSTYRSVQDWDDNVIDVALPSTYNFVETVIDELLAMYKEANAPIHMIHFGGDEVPGGVWEKSPAVQALIKKDSKVNNTDDLWYYYFGKVNDILKARKLNLYGWEEIGLRKVKVNGRNQYIPNPDFSKENFHVDVWNNLTGNEDLAYKLANAGYKVVLSNVTNLYFDLAYSRTYEEPGLYWGGFVDVDKPFYFIPFDYMKNAKEDSQGNPINRKVFEGKERLTEAGKSNIVGLQAALWTEMVRSPERMEYMLLPKLLGLAERAWAPDPAWATETDAAKSEAQYAAAWSQFTNILGKRELPRLDTYAGGFDYRIPTPGVLTEKGSILANIQLPGLTIRYTTNGTEPTVKSKIYTGPVTEKGTIKLRAFSQSGRAGRTITVENK